MANAYFPKSITMFLQPEYKVVRGHGSPEEIRVRSAYPVDTDKPKTHDSAISWASRQTYYERQVNREPITPEQVTRENEPFTGLRIFTLESRGNGGRAYKVVDQWDHYYDLRESELMFSMLKYGVGENGEVRGEWIWCRVGSQMKLLCVGSPAYLAAEESVKDTEKKATMKKIAPKDLEIGGVYVNKNKNDWSKCVYMGRVRHEGKLKFMWADIAWKRRKGGSFLDAYNQFHKDQHIHVSNGTTMHFKIDHIDEVWMPEFPKFVPKSNPNYHPVRGYDYLKDVEVVSSPPIKKE